MIRPQLSGSTDAALKRLGELAGREARQATLLRAGRAVAVAAESVAVKYPQQTRKPLPLFYTRRSVVDGRSFQSKFKSLAQQRLVMAMAAEGAFPRKRTGLLGRSITSRVVGEGGVVIIDIGTNIPYAPLVIGDVSRQSHYHQGNWVPMVVNLRSNVDLLRRAAETEVLAAVREYLKSR